MANQLGRHLGVGTVLVATLVACSSGGGSKTGLAGATGSMGGAGAGAGMSGAAGMTAGAAGSSAAGSSAAGSSAAGTGVAGAGTAGTTGTAGSTPDAGTASDAGATPDASGGHEAGATSCAGRALSLATNGTGSDSDVAHAHVEIDLMADMPIGPTSRTIEFWFYVKPTDWIAEKNEILFYGALKGGTRQVIGLDFGQPAVKGMPTNHATLNPWTDGVYDDDTGKDLGLTSTTSQWVHIAIVWNGLAFITYVNGVARITTPAPTGQPLATLAGLFYVGCLPLNFSCFNGLFDELRVWNVARTPAEIMASYTKAVVGNETGLVGYWKFDDAPGSKTAADSVTTAGHMAHAGTLMSATDGGVPTFVTADPPAPVACP
jgi:Concanavalin A-like lectin/glucanases superfamily